MIVGIARETFPGEQRVALVPEAVSGLSACNADILVESGAGAAAGYADAAYAERGAEIAADRDEVFARAEVMLQVRTLGANPGGWTRRLDPDRSGQVLIGASDPLTAGSELCALADVGATLFAMELMPRITRAQSMDVLSSMATIAGYKAVLLAAAALPRMFPLLMTAAGTLTPSRVLVIGAGVAGLQAIATARRLGAVSGRTMCGQRLKNRSRALGPSSWNWISTRATLRMRVVRAAQDEVFYRRQREELAKVAGQSDVIITTAAIPGNPRPC